ncbi:hypothetical protein M2137_000593 [Parabacteroides sp. PFB2-10]|uniref:hypothetical protein n=1 Tax=Parabacteroides sp. PFB2-10 TaxID=1742405 RepID=UPI002476BA1C|nr:hypothetical protein [Parabacteroides sp. PFB2-10]MDH6311834.1 hypothetical protein [Parabacteroides sp. PFB2-10]
MRKEILFLYIALVTLFVTGCAEDPQMPGNLIGAKGPVATTEKVEGIKATEATVFGKVDKENGTRVTERGFVWYKESNPEEKHTQVVTEGSNESFSFKITSLEDSTKYMVQAYAKNSIDYGYGTPVSFTTIEGLARVATLEALDIKSTYIMIGGKITDKGEGEIQERGIYYAKTSLAEPGVEKDSVASVMQTDSFTCTIPDLEPLTTYYIQAYVKNNFGTSVGIEEEVKTTDGLPIVQYLTRGTVTTSYAEFSAEVTYPGDTDITLRGFCYGLSENLEIGAAGTDTIQCGSGMGVFTGRITDVEQQRPYYVRAFVSNAGALVYGTEIFSFTLLSEKPTVLTASPVVGDGTVIVGGTVVDSGVNDEGQQLSIVEAGIVWSTNENPTIEDTRIDLWGGYNSFTIYITDFPPGSTYHVRAFAINEGGFISYGDNSEFTTGSIFSTIPTGYFSGELQEPNSAAYLTLAERKIGYLVGGDKNSYGDQTNQFWKFDMNPGSDYYLTWQENTSHLPAKRSMMAIASNKDGIHVWGGFDTHRQPSSNHYYNVFRENDWKLSSEIGPTPMFGSFACYQIDIIMIGGVQRTASGDSIVSEVWKQRVMQIPGWVQEADFPEAQYCGYAFAVGDYIYAGLGLTSTGFNPDFSNRLWSTRKAVYDSDVFNWEEQEPMPGDYAAKAGVAIGSSIYIVDSEGYIRVFDTIMKTWSTANSRVPDTHRNIHCVFSDGKKMYIGFGTNRTTICYDPSWDR